MSERSATEEWVSALRAVCVLMQRNGGLDHIKLLPLPENRKRVILEVTVEREDLLRMMALLDERIGPVPQPRPRLPRPLGQQLTSDQRLQEQYRAAGERH